MASQEISFGLWMRKRRKALDITQHELAHKVGCSDSLIFKIESDERRPSRQIAQLLAEHLDIPTEQHDLFLRVARQEKRVDRLEPVLPLSEPKPAAFSQALKSKLPLALTSFIGREHELRAIILQLQNPTCRLLNLTGPGGVGKTRLALEIAQQLHNSLNHGACFISLVGTSTSEYVIPAMADALGFSFSGAIELKAQLYNFLKEKQILLVLDNLEHLLDGIEMLDELLEFAPGVKLLTTSREQLNLRAEWAFEVQGLPIPSDIELDNLGSNNAGALFLQRARQVNMNFIPVQEDVPAIARICQLVEGLPLGLELAATWVSTLSCRDIAAEIERGLDFLATTKRDMPPRHRSLRAVFDHSWSLLTDEERQIVQKLSVFHGGFRREAAQAVAGATLLTLSALVDKSLVQRSEIGRYALHELIRQYSSDRLIKSGMLEETCDLHLEYFLDLAEESSLKLGGTEQFTWLSLLECDHDNFRAALEWSLRNNILTTTIPPVNIPVVQKSLRLAAALYTFWAIRAHWHEGRNWLQRALAQSSGIPLTPEIVGARNAAALLAVEQADLRSARQFAEDNLVSAHEMGNAYTKAQALLTFGTVLWKQKDYAAARINCEQALAQFRALGKKRDIAESLHILSFITVHQGDLKIAQSQVEEGLATFYELGDEIMANATMGEVGTLAYLRKDFGAARSYFEKSLKMFQKAGAIAGEAKTLNRLGDIARCENDYENAERCYRASLRVCREMGEKQMIPTLLHNLGYVAKYHGDFPEALALFKEGLGIHQEADNLAGVSECLMGVSGVLTEQGQAEDGARLFGATEMLRERVGASLWPADQIEHDRIAARLKTLLEEPVLTATLTTGQALTTEQAIAKVPALVY